MQATITPRKKPKQASRNLTQEIEAILRKSAEISKEWTLGKEVHVVNNDRKLLVMIRLWSSLLVLALRFPYAFAQAAQPLTQLQFDIVSIRLAVALPALSVPKNVATQINTQFVMLSSGGVETVGAIAALSDTTAVEADLGGPAIPPRTLTAQPGHSIFMPLLALPGDDLLHPFRLVQNGQKMVEATPHTIPINVSSPVRAIGMTSQPLSLENVTVPVMDLQSRRSR
jgi:hypothetical protein